MIKDILIKKMLKSRLSGVPESEQDKILKLVKENPELFSKIGVEIQSKINEGKDQMSATMDVMKEHQDELKKIL